MVAVRRRVDVGWAVVVGGGIDIGVVSSSLGVVVDKDMSRIKVGFVGMG